MTLSSSGVLSGTPQSGTSAGNVNVRVTDSSTPAQTAAKTLTLDIFGFLQASSMGGQEGVNGNGGTSVGNFLVGGGVTPIVWSIASGTAPPGQTLVALPNDSRTAFLTGSATTAGTFNFTVRAQDSGNPPRVDTAAVQIVVIPDQLRITNVVLPHATLGQLYSQQLIVTGGIPPYAWTQVPLPPGLSLNSGTGLISGTPTAAGSSSLALTVTDSVRQVATAFLPLYVAPVPLAPRNDSLATATPIFPGYYLASLSPYGNPPAGAAPDTDYYKMSAAGGTTWHIAVTGLDKNWGSTGVNSIAMDATVELLNVNGSRLVTCNDAADDNPPAGVPITKDPTPLGFDDSCMNNGTDFSKAKFAFLDFKVPGTGNVDFYIHVFDWRGGARPDMLYRLDVTAQP